LASDRCHDASDAIGLLFDEVSFQLDTWHG